MIKSEDIEMKEILLKDAATSVINHGYAGQENNELPDVEALDESLDEERHLLIRHEDSGSKIVNFIKNNKAMVSAITVGAIGLVSTVLYFLLRENDYFTPTESPFTTIFTSPGTTHISTQSPTSTFFSTTSGDDTTTFFSTADPRCKTEEDCCDQGVWICGR